MAAPRRLAALAALLALAGALPAPARAQGSTDERLQQARTLYEDLQVERALTIFRQVISPSSPFAVTQEQRVTAYKYIGASLASLGQRDSAVTYFRAAIERDPFVDLDPQSFTATERDAFADAKRRTFAVAQRPLAARQRLAPGADPLVLSVLSTHASAMRVELRGVAGTRAAGTQVTLFEGDNDGVREVRWNGIGPAGRLAPPGRYELVVLGASALAERRDSSVAFLDVAHDYPALEDTLPTFRADQLLPERLPAGAPTRDLLKGVAVAGAALLAGAALADRDVGSGAGKLASAAAGVGVASGLGAFFVRSRNRTIAANVRENARRRQERAARNAAIVRRNADRLAQTTLVVAPAGGAR